MASLVLIAHVVFLLLGGHTDRQTHRDTDKVTDVTDRTTYAGVVNKQENIVDDIVTLRERNPYQLAAPNNTDMNRPTSVH